MRGIWEFIEVFKGGADAESRPVIQLTSLVPSVKKERKEMYSFGHLLF